MNPNSTEATEGEDGLNIDVTIETTVTVDANLDIAGFLITEACPVEIGPIPVVYTGSVELDLDGGDVGGTVELSHVVLGTAESTTRYDGCSVGILDTIASFAGYDLTSFINADFETAAQELGDAIERDLITYDIPMAAPSG